jgi:hypothetical protein
MWWWYLHMKQSWISWKWSKLPKFYKRNYYVVLSDLYNAIINIWGEISCHRHFKDVKPHTDEYILLDKFIFSCVYGQQVFLDNFCCTCARNVVKRSLIYLTSRPPFVCQKHTVLLVCISRTHVRTNCPLTGFGIRLLSMQGKAVNLLPYTWTNKTSIRGIMYSLHNNTLPSPEVGPTWDMTFGRLKFDVTDATGPIGDGPGIEVLNTK